MTLEEIRAAKEEAQEAVFQTLKTLMEKTGLAALGVDVVLYQHSTFMDPKMQKTIGRVSIELERI